MSADRFLKQLEEAGLLDDSVLLKVRKQIAASKSPPSARALADALVKSGHLTRFQASKLLEKMGGGESPAKPPSEPAKPKPPADPSEELGLARLDDEDEAPKPRASAPPAEDDEDVVLLEDASVDVSAEELSLDLDDAPDEPPPAKPVAGLQPVDGLQPVSPPAGKKRPASRKPSAGPKPGERATSAAYPWAAAGIATSHARATSTVAMAAGMADDADDGRDNGTGGPRAAPAAPGCGRGVIAARL